MRHGQQIGMPWVMPLVRKPIVAKQQEEEMPDDPNTWTYGDFLPGKPMPDEDTISAFKRSKEDYDTVRRKIAQQIDLKLQIFFAEWQSQFPHMEHLNVRVFDGHKENIDDQGMQEVISDEDRWYWDTAAYLKERQFCGWNEGKENPTDWEMDALKTLVRNLDHAMTWLYESAVTEVKDMREEADELEKVLEHLKNGKKPSNV